MTYQIIAITTDYNHLYQIVKLRCYFCLCFLHSENWAISVIIIAAMKSAGAVDLKVI